MIVGCLRGEGYGSPPSVTSRRPRIEQDRADHGVSLIETLIAIVLLGTAIAALMASIVTGARASQLHRNQSTMDTLLRSYAEAVKTGARQACDGVVANYTVTIALPAGYALGQTTFTCPAAASTNLENLTVTGPTAAKATAIKVRLR